MKGSKVLGFIISSFIGAFLATVFIHETLDRNWDAVDATSDKIAGMFHHDAPAPTSTVDNGANSQTSPNDAWPTKDEGVVFFDKDGQKVTQYRSGMKCADNACWQGYEVASTDSPAPMEDCKKFMADWTVKCSDFGGRKLTDEQKKNDVDACMNKSINVVRAMKVNGKDDETSDDADLVVKTMQQFTNLCIKEGPEHFNQSNGVGPYGL
jgi:hypothetical protein